MGEIAPQENQPHVAVCPSTGIGHLVPFLRLASMLSSSNCKVTLITIHPTLTTAESTQISTFLSNHPQIASIHVQLPYTINNPTSNTNNASTTTKPTDGPDPFFLRYLAVSRSTHLLIHHLSALKPLPLAVFSDIMFASGFNDALPALGIDNYVLVTTSARFFSLTTYLPHVAKHSATTTKFELNGGVDEDVEIPPGLASIPKSSIPPPFFNPEHVFTKLLVVNSLSLAKAKGILFNSFDFLEPETISALKSRKILSDLPKVFPIGPLRSIKKHNVGYYPAWLDDQPCESVLYVSFGSRTPMSIEQIKELGDGLEKSGVRFLWVIRTTKVDNEEKKGVGNLLEKDFYEKSRGKGLVVEDWVDQDAILDHPALGGFMSHCGWNSIMEATQRGLPILAWPQHGDQKVNAGVVAKAGLGIWDQDWGWVGEKVVNGEDIANKIREVMTSEGLRKSARKVGEEAAKAWEIDDAGCGPYGSSKLMLAQIIVDIARNKF